MGGLRGTSPGVVFRYEAGQIRAKVTSRADLSADRLRRQRDRAADLERIQRAGAGAGRSISVEIVGVIEVASDSLARQLEATLRRTFSRSGGGNTYTAADVAKVLVYCRKQRLVVHGLQNDKPPEPPKARKPVIEVRAVPDPMIPRETLLEQIAEQEQVEQEQVGQHRQQRRSDRRNRVAEPTPLANKIQPGYQPAGINLSEAIGGFARVSGRSEAQTEAAMTFRQLADQAQLGGARAVDYTSAKVDTSGPTASAVAENGADARAQYHAARKKLGLETRRLAVFDLLVVEGFTVSAIAIRLGLGKTGRARKAVSTIALEGASVLAMHFGFQAGGRRSVRFDGDQPEDASLPS